MPSMSTPSKPVHPRVGGEHAPHSMSKSQTCGSSPRGRGTPAMTRAAAGGRSVHPRVGGEHVAASMRTNSKGGSSPRGRGTRLDRQTHLSGERFIPAWAGNTQTILLSHFVSSGSSPRGRGTQPHRHRLQPGKRFIPAWAGNTTAAAPTPTSSPVHPRVGGEHNPAVERRLGSGGSSPRGRGTQLHAAQQYRQRRFIPAWAGNTSPAITYTTNAPVHPRVGGEHASGSVSRVSVFGSSPRGRGTHHHDDGQRSGCRFIPAWAGNTWRGWIPRCARAVHPRVGGEHAVNTAKSVLIYLVHPRVGGEHGEHPNYVWQRERFIPAWAGNTRTPGSPCAR